MSTKFVVLIEIPVRYYCKKLRKGIEKNQNKINDGKKLILEEE